MLASQRASWMVTDLPTARPTERRPRRNFTTPPGATPEEELANLQAELTALDRRARQRDEALRALERSEAQVRTGSYPETGDSLLDQRGARLQEAAARDSARRAEIEKRLAALASFRPIRRGIRSRSSRTSYGGTSPRTRSRG